MSKKFLILNAAWRDWEGTFRNNDKIKYINTKHNTEKYNLDDYHLLCMKFEDYAVYYNYQNNIFHNDLGILNMLNNKALFYKYMMQKHIQHIPEVFYYHTGTETYKPSIQYMNTNTKMILKPNLGYNGKGIRIINSFIMVEHEDMQNANVTKYIDHREHYVGQFLVMNGKIIDKVYFKANNDKDHIKIGEIRRYVIEEQLSFDDSVYDRIFKDLNYSGFAHSDFIQVNNTLVMFEINPWIGSCLVRNVGYFNKFIDSLSGHMNNPQLQKQKQKQKQNKLLVVNAKEHMQGVLKTKYSHKVNCVNNKPNKNKDKNKDNYDINSYYILPTRISDYTLYNSFPNSVFKNNNLKNIELLNNKTLFYQYMMEKFIDYIPEVYYYNQANLGLTYIKMPIPINEKMIFKPNIGYYGGGIKIIYNFNPASSDLNNATVTKYIDHTTHYLGHFLVINGQILAKTFFKATNPVNYIKQTTMSNYSIHESLSVDDTIYNDIFKDLNYSGFVHTDFIIHNGKILIFEINPFPSTTFVKEEFYFNQFLDKIFEYLGLPVVSENKLQQEHQEQEHQEYQSIKPNHPSIHFDETGRLFRMCGKCNKKHYFL